jgi:transglutaminase-like putative cysteine protease
VRYRVVHRTRYTYDEPVSRSVNVARLLPRATPSQTVLEAGLEVTPVPESLVERPDFFGNRTHHVALEGGFTELEVTATSVVDVGQPPPPEEPATTVPWEEVAVVAATSGDPDAVDARQFALPSPQVAPAAELDAWAAASFPPGRPLVEAVVDLTTRIHREFEYCPGSTTTSTGPLEVLSSGKGVCQDFTHFALACLRGRGLPARYVSGYLETLPPPGQPRLRGADASHAWLSVWVPGYGWFDVDPTNDQVVGDRHVTTAWGRDYSDVPPLKGVILWEGEDQRLEVAVDVERLEEDRPGPG